MLCFLLGVVVGVVFKSQLIAAFKLLKGKFFAKFLAHFQVEYNKRLRYRKEDLLAKGLKRLQEKNGGQALNVLEIGAGAGANFEFLPAGVKLTCLEPNRSSETYLRANAKQYPSIVLTNFVQGFAEDMPDIATESVDAVICTLVLCSVNDVDKCLKEVVRILKPGGQFFFMEHVSANSQKYDAKTMAQSRTLQNWLFWPWLLVFDCNVRRETWSHVGSAGFSQVHLEHFDAVEMVQPTNLIPLASIIRPHLMGVATK